MDMCAVVDEVGAPPTGRWLHTKGRYRSAVPSFCHLQFFEDWLCCASSVFCVALFVLFCLLMMSLL